MIERWLIGRQTLVAVCATSWVLASETALVVCGLLPEIFFCHLV